AQKKHHQSIRFFEDIATQLYTLLKKKEDAQAAYEIAIEQAISIEKIQEQSAYIHKVNEKIMALQEEVRIARNRMETNRDKLTTAHVEVKKFEKIIQNRHLQKVETMNKKEALAMDEASIQQYINQQVR